MAPTRSTIPPKTEPVSHLCVMGGRGFVGAELAGALRAMGVTVTVYTRGRPARGEAAWAPLGGEIDLGPLREADAVVNLAGESLVASRWSATRKRGFVDSRVQVTGVLCRALAELPRPPRVLVNASGVGYYGDRGDLAVSESSAAGGGFLAELCQAWEAATEPASAAGIRVVTPRFGLVLGVEGGVLRRLLPLFRFGLGGRLGSGEQFMPWISLQDAVGVLRFALERPEVRGPVNAVAPDPCTHGEFVAMLGQVMGRPVPWALPALALHTALGEMADELLLQGAHVRPEVLERLGYRFEHPRLYDALSSLLTPAA